MIRRGGERGQPFRRESRRIWRRGEDVVYWQTTSSMVDDLDARLAAPLLLALSALGKRHCPH